ncbi:MAG TPA: 4-hydroxyphenylpyruvate dioxygenase, partial [Ktedonobacteraceae bacterium]|nr:4-hydroxyphenylpyruvate dioxygenase [Ktedonobacteraceae bacterium]
MSLTTQDFVHMQERSVPQLRGIDYIELYVGNTRQAAHFYRTAFGFTPVAYAGLETGLRDRTSFVMRQGECHLVLTAPLGPDGPVAEQLGRHGDGVKDVAFRVDNVAEAFTEVVRRGAHPLMEPTVLEDEMGRIIKATIAACGDTVHSFIQRDGFEGAFFPTYQAIDSAPVPGTGLSAFDHCAVSLPRGELQHWVDFYTRVLDFHQIHEEGIATEYSAMNSKAVQDSSGCINFVLIEPAESKRKSQIEEFLKFYQGPGVQHVALLSDDIVGTVRTLEGRGVGFVPAPASYYEMLAERVGNISENTAALREVNVLVDRDDWGYLLQIFSLPVQSRPTFFMEIIQRKNARGFGSGNIQALFKALEREQARRG